MWMEMPATLYSNDDQPMANQNVSQIRRFIQGEKYTWQWEHKTGYKNYKDHEQIIIEEAFQKGSQRVRLKSGKTITPMEIFFVDMIQHDPITGNSRRIRRLGKEGCCNRITRWMRRVFRFLADGGNKQQRHFKTYEKMRQAIHAGKSEPEYCVTSLYKDEGICQRLAKSHTFFMLTMLVVAVNAVWICADADRSVINIHPGNSDGEGDAKVESIARPEHVDIIENLFCVFYTLELLIRFCAFKQKLTCIRDSWFCYDGCLWILMIIDNWFLPLLTLIITGDAHGGTGSARVVLLRLARLLTITRLGRIARLLRAMPEMLMLLKGIATATRSVFVTLLLLVALLVVFGVILRTQVGENVELEQLFSSVLQTMWLLLLHCTFLDDVAEFLNTVKDISAFSGMILLIFIFLSSFTVLNMLIGILCEVIACVAAKEKEKSAEKYLRKTLLNILECHDTNNDQSIQMEEFELLMQNPEVHLILTRFGVDVADLIELQDLLFEDKAPPMPWIDSSDDEKERLVLKVTIRSATGLKAMDPNIRILSSGKSDPYCICEVPCKSRLQFTTPVIANCLDPVWDTTGELKPYRDGDSLRFTVWDQDLVKQDDFLGRATLESKVFRLSGFDGEIGLSLPTGEECGTLSVKVEVHQAPITIQTEKRTSLTYAEFVEVVLRLRGGNAATVHDIVELRSVLLDRFDRIHQHIEEAFSDDEATKPIKEEPERNRYRRLSSQLSGRSNRVWESPRRQQRLEVSRSNHSLQTLQTPNSRFLRSQTLGETAPHSPSALISPPETLTDGQQMSLPGAMPCDPVLAKLEDIVSMQQNLQKLAEQQALRQKQLGSEVEALRGQLEGLKAPTGTS